jgi:hypothetical protein
MKLSTAASAGALALVCWTFPALAQAPSQAAPPATAPHSGEFPGSLDPATKIFTPLGPGPKTPGVPVQGTVDVIPKFTFDTDLSALDTIFCNFYLYFDALVGAKQFTNYIAFASKDFPVGLPPRDVQLPYAYTPDSRHFRVNLVIECEGLGDSGRLHGFGVSFFPSNVDEVPSQVKIVLIF